MEEDLDPQLLFRYLQDRANDGFWIWHVKRDYEYLSPRFKEILGFEDDEMENHPSSWQKLINPEDMTKLVALMTTHFEGGPPVNAVVRYTHRMGHQVWVQCRGTVIQRDAEGAPEIMLGTHTDITDLKQTEIKLQHALEQAEALRSKLEAERDRLLNSNVTKTEFVARMNHELRTPLHVIMSYSQLLQMEPGLSDQRREDVGWIHKSGRHMLSVINDLIDLSKMEISGAESMHLEWFPLGHVFRDTVELHRKLAENLQVQLEITLVPSSTLQLYGDVVRFKQLLINLVSNAIKYTDSNGLVIFRVIECEAGLRIEVEDNGCGIPEDRVKDIFTPFNDVAASYPSHIRRRGSALKSSGIGLSLAKRMAELMGMEIAVDTELGIGSTFTVIIPKKLTAESST